MKAATVKLFLTVTTLNPHVIARGAMCGIIA